MRLIAITLLLCSLAFAQSPPPYLDAELSVEERVADLLGRMTTREKVGQMVQINLTRLSGTGEWDRGPLAEEWVERLVVDVGAGSVLSGGGAAPVPNTPAQWARTVNELQRYAVEETRLGIPILYGIDAVHGHNNVEGATIFPHQIGLAATFDPELVRAVARATAEDVAATGISWNFAPVADLGSDPRWGRFYETFGEEPTVVGRLVAAHVEGQGAVERVAATVKHFVGYGQAESGNDRAPADLTLRQLRREQLPPFRSALKSGAHTVMANSGSVDGVPVHASHFLLTEVLRGELGFQGPLLSDWGDIDKLVTVHGVARDLDAAVAMAVNAGVDVVMVPHDGEGFADALLRKLEAGAVSGERIDEAVARILELKFELGLFERPYVDEAEAAVVAQGHRVLALQAALKSLTLLENRDGTLPLRDPTDLLVTGPAALDAGMQLGGWTLEWQGVSPAGERVPSTTIAEGLTELAPSGTVVRALSLEDVLASAEPDTSPAEASTVVLALGEPPYAEGAGDSDDLQLPASQLSLAKELVTRIESLDETRLVLVLVAGRPLVLPDWLREAADALLMAYLPGSEGGSAVAQVIYGEHSPAGRLPFSWPASVGQLPLNNLPSEIVAEPLYPFGYGLSYTRFRYSDLNAEPVESSVRLTLTVENVGRVAGDEVVLAFADYPPLPLLTPQRDLVGFGRVVLEPGERSEVEIVVPGQELAVVPGDVGSFAPLQVLPGRYSFQVGPLTASVELE